MHRRITTKKLEEAVVGKVAAKALAGHWSVVIDFAVKIVISIFKKDTSFIVRMDHKNLPIPGSIFRCGRQSFFSDLRH